MEIPRALLDEYTAQLNVLSAAGQKLVLAALENAEWRTITELRNIMIAVMDEVCSVLAADAAVIASDMYDDIREMSIGKRFGQIAPSSFDGAATAGAVRALIQGVAKAGGTDAFGRALAGRVDYEVKKSAGEAPYKLGAKDPAKPKYARVPSGFETCSFCIMLAGRGFEYRSEKSATYKKDGGHYHPNCDCRIVAGFDGMKVEGYDPDALYERYSDCASTVTDEYGHVDRNAVLNEMSRRNAEWLNNGTTGAITQDDDAEPLPKERQTAEWLVQHGFDVHFRATRSAEGKKTSDILLQGLPWEMKQPRGSGKRNISNQFNEAKGQSNRLIIDISISPWSREDIEREARRQLQLRDDFDEILLVSADYLKRIK